MAKKSRNPQTRALQNQREAERRRRAQAERERQDRSVSRALKRPKPAEQNPQAELWSITRLYEDQMVRPLSTWTYEGKSQNEEKQRISFLRHAFCTYRVPRSLLQHWDTKRPPTSRPEDMETDFRWWLIWIGQGVSLHKMLNRPDRRVLSKRELHMFTKAPEQYEPIRAVWWAKVMVHCGDLGIAKRIAQSRLGRSKHFAHSDNHIDHQLALFFANNPEVGIAEINDIHDYIHRGRLPEDPAFSMKGRSLESIRVGMEEWHRYLRKYGGMAGEKWAGHDIDDFTCHFGKDEHRRTYRFTQIKDGKTLAQEGRRMRHCVYSYVHSCKSGAASVWGVTVQEAGLPKRCLTLEIRKHAVVQARGYANRPPRPAEHNAVKFFCEKRGLRYQDWMGW